MVVACGAADVRPFYAPFPEAQVDTIQTAPNSAIEQLNELLIAEGLELHVASPREGFLETEWFNATTLAGVRAKTTRQAHTHLGPDPRDKTVAWVRFRKTPSS